MKSMLITSFMMSMLCFCTYAQKDVRQSCGNFELVGQWTFEGHSPLKDLIGNFGDLQLMGAAKIGKGALDVGNNAYAKVSGYTGILLKKKTLVAWAKLDALELQGGSLLTIDHTNKDEFDGIVFGEKEKGKWMAGSNWFKRTRIPKPGYQETKTGELVQIAITYKDNNGKTAIKIYRNGKLIGDYSQGDLAEFGKNVEVLFGVRHTMGNTPRGFVDAHIEEARIYKGVLCQKDIQSIQLYDTPTTSLPSTCSIDKSKMIPLRDAKFRKYQYVATLVGGVIKEDKKKNKNYEIHFDTGSWTTSIPYGALDKSKIKVLKKNEIVNGECTVKDPWGNCADLVSGQLSLQSVDGTLYTIKDYKFYATQNKDGTDLPDDRERTYGTGSIMGAFPSKQPWDQMPSLPYAIAEKYSKENGFETGMGIVSNCMDDIEKNWASLKSYLQIGADPKITSNLKWRTDIPLWRNSVNFCPEAVPGFKIKIKFPDIGQSIDTSDDLMATIDTGAPDLTLRLNQGDPQSRQIFATHFVKDGPWKNWRNPYYNKSATTLKNASVTVEFTDSKGEKNSYSFPVGDNLYAPPNTLYAGSWDGGVPWPANNHDKPKNRINLGNTIYFYCPVYFYDIQNKRVGIAFR